jgi:hypothetical protein
MSRRIVGIMGDKPVMSEAFDAQFIIRYNLKKIITEEQIHIYQ